MAASADNGVFERVRDEYLEPVLAEIRRDAEEAAGGDELRATHVFRAFEAYFAGARHHRTLGAWLQDQVFLILAVFLTIIFGAFGLYHPQEGEVSGFLDISKIFAGAVVGGAAAKTATAVQGMASHKSQ